MTAWLGAAASARIWDSCRSADQYLADYSGANGRYRYAKALEMGERSSGILMMAPRYENTAMVLNMRGVHDHCPGTRSTIYLWMETLMRQDGKS